MKGLSFGREFTSSLLEYRSMSAQIRTKNLPYKILIPVLRFCMLGCSTGMLVSQIGWAGFSPARVKAAISPAFLHPLGLASANSI